MAAAAPNTARWREQCVPGHSRSWLSPALHSPGAATTHCSSRMRTSRHPGGEVLNQYQRRADLIPNLVNTVKGFAIQEQQVLIGRDRGARQGGLHPGDPGARQRSRGIPEIRGRAGRAHAGAEEPVRRDRGLPAAEVGCELPRSAGADRGHGESYCRGAQSLHRGGARLQRHGALLPAESDREALWLCREAELHRGKRSGRFQARRWSTLAPELARRPARVRRARRLPRRRRTTTH